MAAAEFPLYDIMVVLLFVVDPDVSELVAPYPCSVAQPIIRSPVIKTAVVSFAVILLNLFFNILIL